MRTLKKLTGSQVKNAKPADKDYKLADGGGLILLVKPNGAKYWRLRYRHGGLEKMLSLGVYPDNTLSSALDKRDDAKKLIAGGIPSAERQAEKAAQADSFQVVAEQFMQEHVRQGTRQAIDSGSNAPPIGLVPVSPDRKATSIRNHQSEIAAGAAPG